jgi:hypothetical protein
MIMMPMIMMPDSESPVDSKSFAALRALADRRLGPGSVPSDFKLPARRTVPQAQAAASGPPSLHHVSSPQGRRRRNASETNLASLRGSWQQRDCDSLVTLTGLTARLTHGGHGQCRGWRPAAKLAQA